MTISAYMSHHIRGPNGDEATPEEVEVNIQAAKEMGQIIREAFPELDLYVPGDQDQALTFLLDEKYITVEQILEADCSIIDQRDFMIMYSQYDNISGGMHHEMNHCLMSNPTKPFISMAALDEKAKYEISGLIAYFNLRSEDV